MWLLLKNNELKKEININEILETIQYQYGKV